MIVQDNYNDSSSCA